MTLTNKRALTRLVFDEAIKTVAEQEFNRLRRITNDNVQVAQNVKAALESLVNLQYGVEPEYNEWEALFYVTWYQPYQINLALAVLQEVYENARQHLGPDFPLHIIDVGCGALAVQFAMAILATEYQQEGIKVIVNGIDPSDPMKKIGETLWLEFWSILSRRPELSDLSHTCDYMTSNCELFNSHSSYYCGYSRDNARPECWIVAIHAVYKSNMEKIRSALQTLRDCYSPSVILVTSHESKRGIARLAAGEDFHCQILNSRELPFKWELRRTTEWRRRLVNRYPEYSLSDVAGLLRTPVEWAPDKPSAVLSKILRGD